MLRIHLLLEELLLSEAHSCFVLFCFKQVYAFRQENAVLKKRLMQGWAKVSVLHSASRQAGGRPQNSRFLHSPRPPRHLIKPTPRLGFKHLKMERNVTGQNLRFLGFLITCKST